MQALQKGKGNNQQDGATATGKHKLLAAANKQVLLLASICMQLCRHCQSA